MLYVPPVGALRLRSAGRAAAAALALTALSAACARSHAPVPVPGADSPAEAPLPPLDPPPAEGAGARAESWTEAGEGGVRGVTIGPIESLRHPGVGYGSPAYERTLDEVARMGATWVSLTPFGRVWDLKPTGIDLSFEAPFEENRRAVLAAIRQAHARGLRVFLVPHLWVESGDWRALIDPATTPAGRAGPRRTARSCSRGPTSRARGRWTS